MSSRAESWRRPGTVQRKCLPCPVALNRKQKTLNTFPKASADAIAHSAARCDIHGPTGRHRVVGFTPASASQLKRKLTHLGSPFAICAQRLPSSTIAPNAPTLIHRTTPATFSLSTPFARYQHLRAHYFLRHGRPRAALRPIHSRCRRRRPAGRPGPEWQPPHSSASGGMSVHFPRR
jgi:hypothetical protein